MKSTQTLFSYCDNSTLCSICLLFNPSPVLMPTTSIFSWVGGESGCESSKLLLFTACMQLDADNTQAAENYKKRKNLFGQTNGPTVPPSHGAKREVAK